jgi:hypothetical protein
LCVIPIHFAFIRHASIRICIYLLTTFLLFLVCKYCGTHGVLGIYLYSTGNILSSSSFLFGSVLVLTGFSFVLSSRHSVLSVDGSIGDSGVSYGGFRNNYSWLFVLVYLAKEGVSVVNV